MEKEYTLEDIANENTSQFGSRELDNGNPYSWAKAKPMEFTQDVEEMGKNYTITIDQVKNYLAPREAGTMENIGSGLVQVGSQILEASAGIDLFFKKNSFPDLNDKEAQDLIALATHNLESIKANRAEMLNREGIGGFAFQASNVIGQAALSAAIGIATGGAAVPIALGGVQEFGRKTGDYAIKYAQETGDYSLKDQSAKDDLIALAYAGVSAAIEAGIGAERVLNGLIAKGSLKQAGKAALGEATEEFLQEYAEYAADSVAGYNERGELEVFKDALTGAVYGALGGGVMGFGMYYANKGKLTELFTRQGFDPATAKSMAVEAIDDAKKTTIAELITRDQLEKHYGQKYEDLKVKIDTVINNVQGLSFLTPEQRTNYVETVASDLSRQVMIQAAMFKTDTDSILNLSDIEAIGNQLVLNTPDMHDQVVLRQRIADKKAQLKELRSIKTQKKAQKLGVEGETEQESRLNLQIQALQNQIKRLDEEDLIENKIVSRRNGGVDVVGQAIDAGKNFIASAEAPTQQGLEGWLSDTPRTYRKWFARNTIPESVRANLLSNATQIKDVAKIHPDIKTDIQNALKRIANGLTMDNFAEMMSMPTRDANPFQSASFAYLLLSDPDVSLSAIASYTERLQAQQSYKDGAMQTPDDIMSQVIKENTPDKWNTDGTTEDKNLLMLYNQKTMQSKSSTIAAIRGGDVNYITAILQENGIKTREMSGTQIKDIARLNWQWFIGKDVGISAGRNAQRIALNAIEQNVVSGNMVLLRNGYTQAQIDAMDDATWDRLVRAAYRSENPETASQEDQIDFDAIPDDILNQTELAAENARLDNIYPAYTGDTIRIIDPAELKQAQYEVIQRTNPMQDEYHVGIRSVNDIKTFDETIDDKDSFVWGDYSQEDAKRDLAKNEITIYSSKPIENGVFVSTSYKQAQEYAGGKGAKVYEKTVPLDYVAWISGDEGQFAITDVVGKKRSVYNSNGERIAQSEPALRNFYKWFGDSKVVDSQGRPLVVYHGTKDDFVEFQLKTGKRYDSGHLGTGFYFTNKEQSAKEYAQWKSGYGEERVLPLYLKIQNPLLLNDKDATFKVRAKKALGIPQKETQGYYSITEKESDQITNEAKKQGYDGIIAPMFSSEGEIYYVAFEPNQIKSVNNRGTFDIATPNIYFQSELSAAMNQRKKAAEDRNIIVDKLKNIKNQPMLQNTQTGEILIPTGIGNIRIVDKSALEDQSVAFGYEPETRSFIVPIPKIQSKTIKQIQNYVAKQDLETAMFHEDIHRLDHKGESDIDIKSEFMKELNPDVSMKEYFNRPEEAHAYAQQRAAQIAENISKMTTTERLNVAGNAEFIDRMTDRVSKYYEWNTANTNYFRGLMEDLKSYILNNLTDDVYYQGAGKHLAGFDPETKAIILSKSMNTGSLPHEMAHFWLQEMFNRMQTEDVPESARTSWNELSRVLGITPDQRTLTADQQEKFANLTEAYIFNKTALPAGTEPVIKDYMEYVPERYNSFLDMGWVDGNGVVQNPILNEDSKRWFDAYYSGMGLFGDSPTMTKFAVSNEPAKEDVRTERQEILDDAHKEVMKTRQDAEKAIDENVPVETKQKIVDKIQDYDAAAKDFLAPAENSDDINDKKRSVWQKTLDILHAGRGTDTREETMAKVNDWVKKHWDEALAIAKLNPNYYDNPTEIPTSLLIRAVSEQNTDPAIKDLLRANFAMAKSLEMKTGGLNNDTHDSVFLIGLGKIQNNLNQAYALKRFGATKNATARVDSEIAKFCERYASDVMSGRKSWQDVMALAATEFGKVDGIDSQVLSQTQLPKNASRQDFIKYMKHLIKVQAGAEMSGEQIAKFNEVATAAQIASTDLDSESESVYLAASAALRRYHDFVAESIVADNWFDKVAGQYFNRAMLSGLTTQTKNLVGNKFENWIVRAAIATKYGKSKVSTETITKERNRLTKIYESSLLSIPQMENLSDPTLVHGEGYGLSDNSVNIAGIRLQTLGKTSIPDPLAMLGRSDFYFRREVYLASLAARATQYATENNLDPDVVFKEFKKLSTTNETAGDARKEAILLGHTAVFTQNGSLAQALNKVRRVLNEMIPLGRRYGLGNLIAPFTKTPSNIVEMGARAIVSPFTSIYEYATTKELSLQHRVDLGNLAGALLLFAVTAALSGDYEPPYKVGEKYDAKRHYDSLRIGGVWIKLDSFGAMETPLRLLLGAISSAKGAWPRVVAGTFAQIPVDISKLEYALTKPAKGGTSFLEGEIDKFIPTIASDAAKALGHQSGIVLDSPYLMGNKTIRKLGLDGAEPSVNDWIRLVGMGIIQIDNKQ